MVKAAMTTMEIDVFSGIDIRPGREVCIDLLLKLGGGICPASRYLSRRLAKGNNLSARTTRSEGMKDRFGALAHGAAKLVDRRLSAQRREIVKIKLKEPIPRSKIFDFTLRREVDQEVDMKRC